MKFKEKQINNRVWRVNQFTGSESFKLMVTLLKMIGPGMAKILGGTKVHGSALNAEVSNEALEQGLLGLLANLDEDSNYQLVLRMLRATTIDGMEINQSSFDLLFQGDLASLIAGLSFVVEVNYTDFLGEGGLLRKMLNGLS